MAESFLQTNKTGRSFPEEVICRLLYGGMENKKQGSGVGIRFPVVEKTRQSDRESGSC